ncbi:unnamed protein product, partial [Prorocentrum cordatum]
GEELLLVPWPLVVSRDAAADPRVARLQVEGGAGGGSGSLATRLWLALHAVDASSPWAESGWRRCRGIQQPGPRRCPWRGSSAGGGQEGGMGLCACARRLREQLLSEWSSLDDRLIGAPLHGEVDWALWLWAQAVVSTRSSTLALAGGRELECIIPVVDFANHSSDPCARVVGSEDGAQLVALRHIQPGRRSASPTGTTAPTSSPSRSASYPMTRRWTASSDTQRLSFFQTRAHRLLDPLSSSRLLSSTRRAK